METRYPTPCDLVQALQDRAPAARAFLVGLLREPLARLLGELASRNRLVQGRDRLTAHALHAAEAYLRARPAVEFEGTTWAGFRGAVLFHVGKLASVPFGGAGGRGSGPGPLPECPAYQSEALSLPTERVGEFWFGGDWYAGRHSVDGALWVLVADVTGHGYFAYLVASTLPDVWRACWERADAPRDPAELLGAMHELLADRLPEGVSAVCTLAGLAPAGAVRVAPGGSSRARVHSA
jgi:hypothetical protein